MKKKLLLISIIFCLTPTMSVTSENQNWTDYFYSKWTTFNNSPYVQFIREKTLSYLLPVATVLPSALTGALIGKTVAEKKFVQPIPFHKSTEYQNLIARKNGEIIRGWLITGGLLAGLAAYKAYSYYQQKSKPKTDNETTSDNNK